MHNYVLLASESNGLYLRANTENEFELQKRCDDNAVWEWSGDTALLNAATGSVIAVEPLSEGPSADERAAIDAALVPPPTFSCPSVEPFSASIN